MADSKLSALNDLSTATVDDIFYVVNDPLGTPEHKKITFDNMQKSITVLGSAAGVSVPGSVFLPVDKVFYLGDETTDGSIRWSVIGGDLVFEKRISGNWVFKGAI